MFRHFRGFVSVLISHPSSSSQYFSKSCSSHFFSAICSPIFSSPMKMSTWVWVNTYRYILVGWTSIYQLFCGSLGTRVLTHPYIFHLSPFGIGHSASVASAGCSFPTWLGSDSPPASRSRKGRHGKVPHVGSGRCQCAHQTKRDR